MKANMHDERLWKIENQRYAVTFRALGGEMIGFLDKDTNLQYLYQGDSVYWSGRNPVLFPIIGNTFRGTYELQGKQYAMKNHGFMRTSCLHCVRHEQSFIVFELRDQEETREQYPFSFCYRVTYQLLDAKVSIRYEITNTGTVDMPFMFGVHPAFRIPLTREEVFEDYHIQFSEPELVKQFVFGTRKDANTYQEVQVDDIHLTYDWITQSAIVLYEHCKSKRVTLRGKCHGVHVDIAGFPYLAFWTPRKGAPFLCVEPWYGHGDYYDVKEDFYHREGTVVLSAHQTFTAEYAIEVF